MNYHLATKHFDVSDHLRKHMDRQFGKVKFMDLVQETEVILSVEKTRQLCEISVKGDGFHHLIKGETHDMYQSVDLVMGKVEIQLKKQKEAYKKTRSQQKRHRIIQELPKLEEDKG